MAKVYIGVGHGGKDPGALGNGFKEKDLALDISKACADTLRAHGVEVMLSRDKDETESLAAKIKECNAYAPTLAVDIHVNAAGGDGAEVYQSKANTYDDMLAKNVYNAILDLGQNGRGIKVKLTSDGKRDYFGWVREVRCPSALVEPAFIDSKDVQIIDTPAERKAMGGAIAKGILKTLGVEYQPPKPTTKPDPKPQPPKRKSNEEIALEVLAGKWGNGTERKKRLTAAGYNYNEVQAIVNKKTAKPPKRKSNEEIALEVLAGKWGNGTDRKKRLTAAGYDYNEVQAIVNKKSAAR